MFARRLMVVIPVVLCALALNCSGLFGPPDLFRVQVGGKFGYINSSGKLVIQPQFTQAGDFSDGMAWVSTGGRYGYIDTTGTMIIQPQFILCGDFHEGRAWANNGTTLQYIDKSGTSMKTMEISSQTVTNNGSGSKYTAFFILPRDRIIKGSLNYARSSDWYLMMYSRPYHSLLVEHYNDYDYDLEYMTGNGMILNTAYTRNNPDGLLTTFPLIGDYLRVVRKSGFGAYSLFINPTTSGDYHEGLAWAPMNGKFGYIDKNGDSVIIGQFDGAANFSEELACVLTGNGKWGYINTNGNIVIQPIFDQAGDFHEDLACIKNNNKYGFIDKKGTIVIQPQFDWVGDFHEGKAVAKVGVKYGFIDTKGALVVQPLYDFAGNFSEGLAFVRQNNKEGYIDTSGSLKIPFTFDQAYDFKNSLAKVEINNGNGGRSTGYIDKTGKYIWAPSN